MTWSLVLSVHMRLPQAFVLLKVLDDFNLDRIRPPTSRDGLNLAQDFNRLIFVFVSLSLFPPSEDLNLWTQVSWICQSSICCICEEDEVQAILRSARLYNRCQEGLHRAALLQGQVRGGDPGLQ